MKNFTSRCLILTFIVLISVSSFSQQARWWPAQKAPKSILRAPNHEKLEKSTSPNGQSTEGGFSASHILLQVLQGLSAKAVNEGTCDEMIWIEVGHPEFPLNPNYELWLERTLKRLNIKDKGSYELWDLVKHFKDNGVVKGYILYSYDYNEGIPYLHREKFDRSVNVATTMASIHNAVVIEEGQEEKAKQLGLEKLFDARGKDMKWCFNTYKDQLNRDCLATVDPKVAHCRAFAVANKAMTIYGVDDTVKEVLAWLNPLSCIAGWNIGDEGKHTKMITRLGHVHTASNWSLNTPLLASAAKDYHTLPTRTFDPTAIDWDKENTISFAMSDGDNIGWFMGDICYNRHYWSSPSHGDFPFGWTTCIAGLSQVSPETAGFLFETQRPDTTLIEFAGGYHYPDMLGIDRPEKDILVRHARRLNDQMNKNKLRVLGFIAWDLDSPAAKKAYQVFAREIDNLAGMIAIQYHPYEGGNGEIFWVKNKKDIEIPVVTAKYSVWAHRNLRESNNPAKLAATINADARTAGSNAKKFNHWAIVHAWSSFKKNEDGEVVNANYMEPGSETGVTPIQWCVDRLDKSITVVSPEEMIWRIRMNHNPAQTKQAIKELKQN